MRFFLIDKIKPACVAPAKNNFICESIAKRDIARGTQGAVRGVTPVRRIRMLECAYNFVPSLESDGAHTPYCTNDCLYRHAIRRKLKLETAYDPQRETLRMRASPVCVSKST
jgi:hypothetical protein